MVAALNICCVEIGRLSEREGNGIVLTRYTVSHTDQIDTERESESWRNGAQWLTIAAAG